MANTDAFVSIEYVVASYLNQKGIYSLENMERYKNIVIENYTDLNIRITLNFDEFRGTPSAAGILTLPSDFIDWWDISIISEGMKYPLKVNKDLDIAPPGPAAVYVAHPENLNTLPLPVYGPAYATGGGFNVGEITVKKKDRIIIFAGGTAIGQEIVVTYVSSGVNMTGTTLIPRELVPLLKAYLHYSILSVDDEAPANKVKMAHDEYILQQLKYNTFKNDITYSEIYDILAGGWSQSPKR